MFEDNDKEIAKTPGRFCKKAHARFCADTRRVQGVRETLGKPGNICKRALVGRTTTEQATADRIANNQLWERRFSRRACPLRHERWHGCKLATGALAVVTSMAVCCGAVAASIALAPAEYAYALDEWELPLIPVKPATPESQKLQAPVVSVAPMSDGSVMVKWTESPLTSNDPNKDMRTYNLYLYQGNKTGELKSVLFVSSLANLNFALPSDWFQPGKRYTVVVEAVNETCPDDANGVARSESVSFTAPAASAYPVGDVNGNGVLNIIDAQIAYDIATTSAYADASDCAALRTRADVTLDGEVDAVDAFAIQHAALFGWEE